MSNEDRASGSRDAYHRTTTFVYDSGGPRHVEPPVAVCRVEVVSRPAGVSSPAPVPAPAPPEAAEAVLRRHVEFRLAGAETQEQAIPLPGFAAGHWRLSAERVRVYLPRGGTAAAGASIGGVEVHVELRDGRILCTAQATDFDPGELIVVQVELAVYARE